MTFADTNPITFPIESGKRYLMTSNNGNVTVEKMLEDNNWYEVQGSPISSGEETYVKTISISGTIRVTPSAAGVIFNMKYVRE